MTFYTEDTKDDTTCTMLRDEKSKVFIWKSEQYKGLAFFCGDFSIEEVEQVLVKMKELQVK